MDISNIYWIYSIYIGYIQYVLDIKLKYTVKEFKVPGFLKVILEQERELAKMKEKIVELNILLNKKNKELSSKVEL